MEDESKKQKKEGTGRNDALWKGVIEDLTAEFIDFFMPEDAGDYDLSTVQFLDKELEVLLKDKNEDRVKKFVDKLISIERKSKKGKKGLLHIEIEGTTDREFPSRMFHYGNLINGKYNCPTNAFVIFTGSLKQGLNRHTCAEGHAEWAYNFGTYYVNNQTIENLKESSNPIALIIMTVKLFLIKNKLSVAQLMAEFEWIYIKLSKTEISIKQKETIDMFLEDYMPLCIPNKKTFHNFVDKLKLVTKNVKIMGVREMVMEEGEEKMLKKNIKRLLSIKYSVRKVAYVLEVSLDYVKQIKMELKNA